MKNTVLNWITQRSKTLAFAIVSAAAVTATQPLHAVVTPPSNADLALFQTYIDIASGTTKNIFTASTTQLKTAMALAVSNNAINLTNAVSQMQILSAARGNAAGDLAAQMLTSLGTINAAYYNMADDIAGAATAGSPKVASTVASKVVGVLVTGSQTGYADDVTSAVISAAPASAGAIAKSSLSAVKSKAPAATGSIISASLLNPSIQDDLVAAGLLLKTAASGNIGAVGDQAEAAFASGTSGASRVALYSAALYGAKVGDATVRSAIEAKITASTASAGDKDAALFGLALATSVKADTANAVTTVNNAIGSGTATVAQAIAGVRAATYALSGKAADYVRSAASVPAYQNSIGQVVFAATAVAPTAAGKIAAGAITSTNSGVVSNGLTSVIALQAIAASPAKAGDVVKELIKAKIGTTVVLTSTQVKNMLAAVVTTTPGVSANVGLGITGSGVKDDVKVDYLKYALNQIEGASVVDIAPMAATAFKTKSLRTSGTVADLASALSSPANQNLVNLAATTVTDIVVTDGSLAKKPSARLSLLLSASNVTTSNDQRAVVESAMLVASSAEGVALMTEGLAETGTSLRTAIYNRAYGTFATTSAKQLVFNQAYALATSMLDLNGVGGNASSLQDVQNLVTNWVRTFDNAGIAADLTTASITTAWKRSSVVAYAAVLGSPKQAAKVVTSAVRYSYINKRSTGGDIAPAGATYTGITPGFGTVDEANALVTAAIVGAAVQATDASFATVADDQKNIKAVVSAAVKEVLKDITVKTTDILGGEGQEVRGATAGGLLGITTTLGDANIDTTINLIATEAAKAAKLYYKDIAQAIGVVLGTRGDIELTDTGRFSAIAAAINAAVSGSDLTAIKSALASGRDTAATDKLTPGTLAYFVASHSSGSSPLGLPVTDISGL